MATNVLEQLTEQRIASVGYLSLPFKNYFTYQSTHTSTSRFNVNSASWDRLWVVYRPTAYGTQKEPVAVSGHKNGSGNVTYDVGGSYTFNTNNERYISNYFKFVDPGDTNTKYNLQVNSANVPAYKMSSAEALSMTKGAVDMPKNVMSLDQYRNDFFVQCYRFCLPDSDFNRLASGLDTRSVSAQGTLETTSVNACALTLFAECSSELRVGSGRAIEIIQ